MKLTNWEQKEWERIQKDKILQDFEDKFVADNIADCIPTKNWEEMKDEVFAFFLREIINLIKLK